MFNQQNQPTFEIGQLVIKDGVIGIVKGIWWQEWVGAWQMSVIVAGQPYPQLWWCETATPLEITEPQQYGLCVLLDDYGYAHPAQILSITSEELYIALLDRPDLTPDWIDRRYLVTPDAAGEVAA